MWETYQGWEGDHACRDIVGKTARDRPQNDSGFTSPFKLWAKTGAPLHEVLGVWPPLGYDFPRGMAHPQPGMSPKL